MKLNKKKTLIYLLGSLTLISSFSIGFASWELTGGSYALIQGIINSDSYTDIDKPISTFTITNSPTFTALTGRGFLNSNNEYVDSVSLTWTISFNSHRAADFIESLSEHKIWMSATLSASSNSAVMANFSISSMTNGLGTATTIKQNGANTYNSGTYISQHWNITNLADSNSILFQLGMTVSFTGALTSFPNLSTNKLTLTLLPGEYENA